MMQYANLGPTGARVSRICLGCMSFGRGRWELELEDARPIINRALDLGVNFFDTANVYGGRRRSEEIIGETLKGRRDDVIIATKVFFPMGDGPNDHGLSRIHIYNQINESLARLGTDHVDLYQIHRWDRQTPIEETLVTLNDLVRQGKVRYIGASSMWAWQLEKALWTSKMLGLERFVTMQNLYNLNYREEEREMIPLCTSEKVSLIPWSPIGGGFLTGKYKRGGESPQTRRAQSGSHSFRRRI
jgi:aryl-alcohol dehydrogenase (NADP+)